MTVFFDGVKGSFKLKGQRPLWSMKEERGPEVVREGWGESQLLERHIKYVFCLKIFYS